MANLTEAQLIAVMMEETRLLVIQALNLVRVIQRKNFQNAFNNYEPILERVSLRGMLLRTLTLSPGPN